MLKCNNLILMKFLKKIRALIFVLLNSAVSIMRSIVMPIKAGIMSGYLFLDHYIHDLGITVSADVILVRCSGDGSAAVGTAVFYDLLCEGNL